MANIWPNLCYFISKQNSPTVTNTLFFFIYKSILIFPMIFFDFIFLIHKVYTYWESKIKTSHAPWVVVGMQKQNIYKILTNWWINILNQYEKITYAIWWKIFVFLRKEDQKFTYKQHLRMWISGEKCIVKIDLHFAFNSP